MSATTRCAFLSTVNLDGFVVDDDRAYAALRARGMTVERVAWQVENVDWDQFDLVVVRSTWDYQHDSDRFFNALERIDASRALLANPLPAMRWNARKTYLRDLASRGINIVATSFGNALDAAALADLERRFGNRAWIIKPVVGANAGGVYRLDPQSTPAQRGAVLAHFAERDWMAQPFQISVTQVGEYSLFYFDGAYSHGILKTPKAGDFRVQEEHGGRIAPITVAPDLRAMGDAVCAQLPNGCLYVRVDIVCDHNARFAVMEVELIEPSLYLRMDPPAPDRFADAVVRWLARHVGTGQ